MKGSAMPKVKEFTVTIEDKPGALGKCFAALAERGVNILAFQSYVEEGESLARLLADDSESAKAVLGELRMIFEETEAATVRLAHRPGELGRAASRLGEHQINIDYSYSGESPDRRARWWSSAPTTRPKPQSCWTNWKRKRFHKPVALTQRQGQAQGRLWETPRPLSPFPSVLNAECI